MAAESAQLLERYLKNNDPPTPQELDRLSGEIQAPLQRLSNVERRMQDLERELESLKKARAELHQSVANHRTVISLIRRVPDEILGEIFERCLPQDHFPALHFADPPFLLTLVCKRWRSIALSTPTLWSSLHVTVDSHDVPEVQPGVTEETVARRTEAAEGYLAFLETCFSRSKGLPLHLSVRVCWSVTGSSGFSRELKWVGSAILPRVEVLHWSSTDSGPEDMGYKFLSLVPVEKFQGLRELKLEWPSRSPFETGAPPIFRSPTLRQLDLVYWARCPSNLPLKWSQLTRLVLEARGFEEETQKISDAIEMLKRCPALEECNLHLNGHGTALSTEEIPPYPGRAEERPIPLRFLRSLSITHYHRVEKLTRLLYIPSLTSLSLMHLQSDNDLPYCSSAYTLPNFVDFHGYCLPSIERLDINVRDYCHSTILRCLASLPNIRHLAILKAANDSASWSPEEMTYDHNGFNENLIVRMTPRITSNAETPGDGRASVECLCPLLERFDFLEKSNYTMNRNLTLDTIVPFVASKWEFSRQPEHRGRISPLKHLTVPTRTLPDRSVKHALKDWRKTAGLVLEIAYPYLNASQKPSQYDGIMFGHGGDE